MSSALLKGLAITALAACVLRRRAADQTAAAG